jgi:hypothetical protein
MDCPKCDEIIGEPSVKLDGKINLKRKAWENAININQIDGEWIPSKEYKELMEKEINGEITTKEMKEILNKKYDGEE